MGINNIFSIQLPLSWKPTGLFKCITSSGAFQQPHARANLPVEKDRTHTALMIITLIFKVYFSC